MANTVEETTQQILLSAIDSNWDYGERTFLQSIVAQPGAAGDKFSIRDGSATGPLLIPNSTSLAGEAFQVTWPRGLRVKPFLVFSECTLSAGAKVWFNKVPGY